MTTNKIFHGEQKCTEWMNTGQGRLGDGGEIFGDASLTGAEVVSTGR
jgi:hypothetical protein